MRCFFTDNEFPFEEMDGQHKAAAEEMPTMNVCWELPAEEKPVELQSPSKTGAE